MPTIYSLGTFNPNPENRLTVTYTRPRGIHETTYDWGELSFHLARQLFLLRESLIRTAIHPTFYPELFRALRVLVIDGERGRLGGLARHLDVTHGVTSILSNEPPGQPRSPTAPDGYRDLRVGLENMMFFNPCSRWLRMRGIEITKTPPCEETDFWVYLEDEVISNKAEFAARVSRAALIAEIANTRDVVHASMNYPSFLRGTDALGCTGRYFIEVAQEVAYEALSFGEKVIAAALTRYPQELGTARDNGIPIPAPCCGSCGRPFVALDSFSCLDCGVGVLPEPLRPTMQEQLSSLLQCGGGADKERGTLAIHLDTEALHAQPLAEFLFARVKGQRWSFVLTRTGGAQLTWEVSDRAGTRRAIWNASESPNEGRRMFFLAWGPEQISITSSMVDGTMIRMSDDGSRHQLTAPAEATQDFGIEPEQSSS